EHVICRADINGEGADQDPCPCSPRPWDYPFPSGFNLIQSRDIAPTRMSAAICEPTPWRQSLMPIVDGKPSKQPRIGSNVIGSAAPVAGFRFLRPIGRRPAP